MKTGYVIYVDSVVEGSVPLCFDEFGKPHIFPTRAEAEHDIVDSLMMRLEEFKDGLRDFEDAIFVEEYLLKVAVFPDGTIQPIGLNQQASFSTE